MAKVKILHSLLILVLVSGLLVGCQPRQNEGGSNGGQNASQEDKIPQDLKQSLNEFNTADQEFNSSLTQFRAQLKEVVDSNKPQNQRRNPNNVDFKTPNAQLEKLRQASDNFSQTLKTSGKDWQDAVSRIPNEIDTTIGDIRKVIEPLKNGLERGAVIRVQKSLDLDKDPAVSQNLGNFGPKTQDKINSFLQAKSNQLANQMAQLKQAINPVTTADTNAPLQLSSEPEFQTLVARVSKLEEVNKTLNTQAKELSQRIWTVVIVAIGAIGALLYLLFRENKARNVRGASEKALPSERNSAFEQRHQEHPVASAYRTEDIKKLHAELDRLSHKLETLHSHFSEQETKLQTLERYLGATSDGNSPYRSVTPTQAALANQPRQTAGFQSKPAPTNQYSDWSNVGWVATYNKNPGTFSTEATEVSETEESIEARRLGSSQATVVEKSRKGNYWVLIKEGFNYLVPKANIKINEYNYKTVEALFECQGYQPGYSSDFKLLKPAIVSPIVSGEKWQLVELGVLQF